MRLGLDFIMSENLSAHYQAQVGTFTWGGPASGDLTSGGNKNEALGGALGTRAANIVTRFAYLDWMIPNTDVKVRMGQQPVALPSFTFGSPVLDSSATGIVVAAPVTENIGITGMWLRAESDARRGTTTSTNVRTDDNADLFGLVADFKYDGFRVQPWAVVGTIGKDARVFGSSLTVDYNGRNYAFRGSNDVLWYAGVSGELTMLDPFRFTADFYYSSRDSKLENTGGFFTNMRTDEKFNADQSGWYAALGGEYKTAIGTPALKGWYATGDKRAVSYDVNGNAYYKTNFRGQPVDLNQNGAFNPTSTFFDGRYGIAQTMDKCDAGGTWGVSAQWNGINFIESLTHDLSVTYVQGTNNKHNAGIIGDPTTGYLTSKDSLVEVDFNTTYNIYQNLATVLELSYIFEDFDGKNMARNVLGTNTTEKAKFSNAWRAALNFRYTF